MKAARHFDEEGFAGWGPDSTPIRRSLEPDRAGAFSPRGGTADSASVKSPAAP